MKRARFSLSQETITILTVGVALAGIIFVNQGSMRAEARADRARTDALMDELRTEARADRARTDAALNEFRAEARAGRARLDAAMKELRAEAVADRARTDALLKEMRAEGRADREAFAKQITQIIEQQGSLSGLVEGLGRAIVSSGE